MANRKMIEFFDLVTRLNKLKNEMGFTQDLLTPGFIKEVMTGYKLGHYVHRTKHGPDAYNDESETEKYEYLSCKEGGSFQLDRIDDTNLHRIERNDKFYFASFNNTDGITIEEIYVVDTSIVLSEAKVKISKMSASSKHIGFSLNWVKQNGKIVYKI
tara:strand:+ start:35 stop:505 length:471 start_codon:yes stop_codon:yes gene_type:complete